MKAEPMVSRAESLAKMATTCAERLLSSYYDVKYESPRRQPLLEEIEELAEYLAEAGEFAEAKLFRDWSCGDRSPSPLIMPMIFSWASFSLLYTLPRRSQRQQWARDTILVLLLLALEMGVGMDCPEIDRSPFLMSMRAGTLVAPWPEHPRDGTKNALEGFTPLNHSAE